MDNVGQESKKEKDRKFHIKNLIALGLGKMGNGLKLRRLLTGVLGERRVS